MRALLGNPFKPMEPVRWPAPFDDPGWLFQPKWDGIRIVAHWDGKEARLFNKRGQECTARYPEIVAALPAALSGRTAILDGEMVVFYQGRPSFPRVMQRALARRPAVRAQAVAALPATYLVFDLVYLDGRELMPLGLEERLARLAQALAPAEPVVLTDSFPAQGRLLFAAVEERGWEGIVAKRRASPYRPGKSAYWRKIKVRRRQLCAVGGFTVTGEGAGALLLGAYQEETFVYVGRAGSGLTAEHRRLLPDLLAPTETSQCPFVPAPRLRGLTVRWVRPTLTVLVEYAEWTEELHLRHPVIVRFTPEPVSACRLP